jgi:hypothetical protein
LLLGESVVLVATGPSDLAYLICHFFDIQLTLHFSSPRLVADSPLFSLLFLVPSFDWVIPFHSIGKQTKNECTACCTGFHNP